LTLDTAPVLTIENLSFRYRAREEWAVEDVSITVAPGELILVAGTSGCGKTTLARCINGLIPRSYRGELKGVVRLGDHPVGQMALADVSQTVGTLLQNPDRQIVASSVEGEIRFGPENLGLPAEEIYERVDETLARLKIEHLRDRETFALSGGEKQKVALAGVLAMHPSILLLDEPLASLDPAAAQEALALFRQLVEEGVTVVLIEHRVEDVLALNPDRVMYMSDGKVAYLGPSDGLAAVVDPKEVKLPAEVVMDVVRRTGQALPARQGPRRSEGEPILVFDHVDFAYEPDKPVLRAIDLTVNQGEVVAVLGPNGAGKSTLVKHAIGLLKPKSGHVRIRGVDTSEMTVAEIARSVGYVFQSPSHMLFAPTVEQELAFGPKNLEYDSATIAQSVARSVQVLNLEGLEQFPPLSLSYGQQKRLTIACVVAMKSAILAMDEPTAGQDYGNYTRFMSAIVGGDGDGQEAVAAEFAAVLFITHDLDLAVRYAAKAVLLSDGRVAAYGPVEQVLQDLDLLRACHLVPTSLLRANLRLLGRTGRFMAAEELASLE
jgi:energy-coupling factor transport system ATP-binding protein